MNAAAMYQCPKCVMRFVCINGDEWYGPLWRTDAGYAGPLMRIKRGNVYVKCLDALNQVEP